MILAGSIYPLHRGHVSPSGVRSYFVSWESMRRKKHESHPQVNAREMNSLRVDLCLSLMKFLRSSMYAFVADLLAGYISTANAGASNAIGTHVLTYSGSHFSGIESDRSPLKTAATLMNSSHPMWTGLSYRRLSQPMCMSIREGGSD